MEHRYRRSTQPVFYKSWGSEIGVDGRRVSGYLASFDTKDSADDIFIKGAFTKSLQERGVGSSSSRKIAFLYQHDMKEPLGRFTTLHEDHKGLYFEADIDKIPLGDKVIEQYKSGTLNQHSVGFKYIWDKVEYDDDREAFILKEVNLFEGSVVTLGANENTPFMGMKGEQIEMEAEVLNRETEMFLSKLPMHMEMEARQLILKHIALGGSEPIEFTRERIKPQFDIEKAIDNLKFF